MFVFIFEIHGSDYENCGFGRGRITTDYAWIRFQKATEAGVKIIDLPYEMGCRLAKRYAAHFGITDFTFNKAFTVR